MKPKTGLTAGIDWLTVTKKARNVTEAKYETELALRLSRIYDTVGDEAKQNGFVGHKICNGAGFAGWSHGATNDIAIVNLPGQALEAIRQRDNTDAQILETFKTWRTTRIDFAVDTTNPLVTPFMAAEQWDAENVTCKADEIKEIETRRRNGQRSKTVYIGASSSSRMLRIYDKRAQLEFVHGMTIDHPWTRFELQSRHDAADAMATLLRNNGIAAGRDVLNGWITFRKPGEGPAKRREPAKWWSELIGTKK